MSFNWQNNTAHLNNIMVHDVGVVSATKAKTRSMEMSE